MRARESRTLTAADVTIRHGISVTTVERTLVDRAGEIGRDALERELHEAQVLGIVDLDRLRATMERAGRRKGIGTLRSLLDDAVRGPTRSELERAFAKLRLPPHERNATIRLDDRIIQADAYWPEAGLIIELDGRAAHDTARAFHADRDRDLAVSLAGLLSTRLTWRHVTRDARRTERRVIALIEKRPSRATPGVAPDGH